MKITPWRLAATLAALYAGPALAQERIGYTAADGVNSVYVTSQQPLPVISGSGTNASQIQGTSASGGIDDASNPVKIGGLFTTINPTLTSGQRGTAQLDGQSRLQVSSGVPDNTNPTVTTMPMIIGILGNSGGSINVPQSINANASQLTGSRVMAAGLVAGYNTSLPTYTGGQYGPVQMSVKGTLLSTSVDPVTGSSAFFCGNSAIVNVSAGSTIQVVALAGSAAIRVCSVVLSMNALGTVGVYYGTGTNCATGTATLVQDMTLAAGAPLQISAPLGTALFRAGSGSALCIKATAGDVTGFVTYAQF